MKTIDLFVMLNTQGAIVFPSATAMAYFIETEDQNTARTCCSIDEFEAAYMGMNLNAIDLFSAFTKSLAEHRFSIKYKPIQETVDDIYDYLSEVFKNK